MLAQLLDFATPSLREIAAQAGISYAAIQNYRKAKRTPDATVMRRLTSVLYRRGAELQRLASAVGRLSGKRTRRHTRTTMKPHGRTTA